MGRNVCVVSTEAIYFIKMMKEDTKLKVKLFPFCNFLCTLLQIIIQSRPCRPPVKTVFNDKDLTLLKQVMSRRYDPSAKSLDLGNLTNDAG